MSKDAFSTSSRSINDGSASGGILSKASSSLRRSPSSKHKSQPSNPLPSFDQIIYETQKAQASDQNPPPQKRPNASRYQTAPLDGQTTKYSLKEIKTAPSAVEATVIVTPVANPSNARKETPAMVNKSPAAGPPNGDHIPPTNHGGAAVLSHTAASLSGSQNPNILYHHIQEMANKRIATLDYFRKAHEDSVFWFNTVHFSRSDLSKLPVFSPAKLSRRAKNYLLLGLSIPPVLDVHQPQSNPAASTAANASTALEFLKSLNALLGEFETYQQIHPPEGGTASSLSRANLPRMFKRATHATSGRTRRTSSNAAPEIGLPIQQMPSSSHSAETGHHHSHPSQSSTANSLDTNHPSISSSTNISITAPSSHPVSTSVPTSSFSSFPSTPSTSQDLPNSTLSPSEGPYTLLLTPPLPFIPDFYTVFATLCDILIDTYQRILALINSPSVCSSVVGSNQGSSSPGLGEMFAKADARLRKVIVGGLVKDFEGSAREGGKRELLGVQRVVLGGLVGI